MVDEFAFLGTILDYPDQRGPYEVYSDWLEEQGCPLAEKLRAAGSVVELQALMLWHLIGYDYSPVELFFHYVYGLGEGGARVMLNTEAQSCFHPKSDRLRAACAKAGIEVVDVPLAVAEPVDFGGRFTLENQ